MKTTTFYKLRKPEGTDPVNLEDFNVNFDDIDKALKEAADASGDLSRGKVFATQASERANFDSGDTLATGFGKIMKWFSDLKSAAFATLVNNDITTAEGYAADARIVKTHGDEIDALVTKTDNMKASFQAGVDGIYNAITAQGTTPASKSQSDVQAAISTLANSSYNKGYAAKAFRRILLGTGGNGNYSATGVPNWQGLTNDNFVFVPTKVHYWGGTYNTDGTAQYIVLGTSAGGDIYPSVSYNAGNGIVTVTGCSAEAYSNGYDLHGSSAKVAVTGNIYCVVAN